VQQIGGLARQNLAMVVVRAQRPNPGDAVAVDWPDELEALYRESYRSLVQVAYLMVGSRDEAEEIVQDAIVATATRWDTIHQPRAYLRTAVVHGAIGRLRRRRVVDQHRPDAAPLGQPDHLVELRDSLLALPERQRAAIVLRYVSGLDDGAIAEVLECRTGSVRSLISRGLAALRTEVTP
jgi:RNA polymerase sigma factor (sigma-70 family)